jgi:phage terminase small subunit
MGKGCPKMPENLTPKQRKAIEALLSNWDTTKAAQAAGVSRDTLYRWMRSNNFKGAMQDSTQAALENLSRGLVTLAKKAIDALEKAVEGDSPLQVAARVRAADIILGRLLQLTELVELEARVSALEAERNGPKK